MFDRTFIVPTRSVDHHHHHRTEVHEHRAPTDDSVKLLKEMEEKALAKLIGSAVIADNEFSGAVHTFREYANWQIIAVARAKLNGREIEARVTLDQPSGDAREFEQKLILALRDELAKQIANTMLIQFSRGMHGRLLR